MGVVDVGCGRVREEWQYRATKDRGRRRVTELAGQKEMIPNNDRSVECWTFVHFAEQNVRKQRREWTALEGNSEVDVG